jgi:hypothetical protein
MEKEAAAEFNRHTEGTAKIRPRRVVGVPKMEHPTLGKNQRGEGNPKAAPMTAFIAGIAVGFIIAAILAAIDDYGNPGF